MAEDNKKKIWVRLGNQKDVPISINPADENLYMLAVKALNELWASWRDKLPKFSDEEVMSRVAFQFAKLYVEACQRMNEINKRNSKQNTEINAMLADFEQKLNDILVTVKHED